jgi:hypothetical protein
MAGLMWAMIFIKHPGRSIPPKGGHALDDPRDWLRVILAWAKVISSSKAGCPWSTGQEYFSKPKVSVQGFENMLPRANGMRTANTHRLSRKKAADEIRNQAIRRPVASADDVAGTSSGNRNPVFS